ncbi:unnamed protein product [Closterium sp. NIES-53]
MDVWGSPRVSGQGHERYFLLVVNEYTRYTTVFPLCSKGEVPDVLIPWICAVRLQLCERFREDLPVLRLHSDKGGEFSSDLLQDFCRGEGILQPFTLPASPQQNGVAECRIGLVMEVARTSMIYAAAPHFLWPFAVRYAAHQLNLWPCVSFPETSPTLHWKGKVGDASVFWSGALFYHPTSRRILSSQEVMCPAALPRSRSRSGAARGAASEGAEPGGAEPTSAEPGGVEPASAEPGGVEPASAEPGGSEPDGAEPGGAESEGAELGGAKPEGAEPGGTEPEGADSGGTEARGAGANSPGDAGVSAGAGGAGGAGAADLEGAPTRAGDPGVGDPGAGGTGAGGAGAGGVGAGDPGAGGAGVGGARAASSRAGDPGAGGAGAGGAGAGGTGAGDPGAGGARTRDPGAGGAGAGDPGAGDPRAGGPGAGGAGAGDPGAKGAGAGGAGAGGTGAGGTVQRRPFFVPSPPSSMPPRDSVLRQVLNSPLPAPSPYAEQTDSVIERREPASSRASPVRAVRTDRRVPRPRPPPDPGTHIMALCPSSVPLRVPLSSPPASSLADGPDPESDLVRAASPTVPRLLATVVTDPSFDSAAASALIAELVEFAAACRLDYAASLVAESESDCLPSIGGECALGTDVLEDKQEDF